MEMMIDEEIKMFSLSVCWDDPLCAWQVVNKRPSCAQLGKFFRYVLGVTFALVVEVRYGVSSSDRGHVHLPWWQALGWLCVAVP
jgi:hypothetical protein